MRKYLIFLLLLGVLLSLGLPLMSGEALEPPIVRADGDDKDKDKKDKDKVVAQCISDGPFDATVRIGPNAGLALTGLLILEIRESGSARGVVLRADDSQVRFVGQVTGRAMSLLFELDEHSHLFGTGVEDVAPCGGFGGGTFAGPAPGDIGDWNHPVIIEGDIDFADDGFLISASDTAGNVIFP